MICTCEDKELWITIESRAQKYPNLKFRESIPYSNIQDHYDRARFLVSTSSAEGFPNVMIQAAQGGAGIISLALDPDGFIDTFGAGFCAGGDLKLFVTKTKQLLADAECSVRIGANAEIMIDTWLNNQTNVSAFLNGLE